MKSAALPASDLPTDPSDGLTEPEAPLPSPEVRQHLLGVLGFIRASLSYLRPYPGQATLVLLSLLPAVAFTTLQPVVLKALVDEAIIPGNVQLATLLIIALGAVLATDTLGVLANHYLVARLGATVMNDIRVALFRHVQQLSLAFYNRSQLGDLLSRFGSDLSTVEQALTVELPSAITYFLTISAGIVVLIAVDARLAALTLVMMPVIYLGPRVCGSRVNQASYLRQQDSARLVTTVQENLSAQPVVKAFSLEGVALRRFQGELNQLARSSTRLGLLQGFQAATIGGSGATLLVISIAAGTFLVMRGELSVGSLVAFFELIWWMVTAVQELSNVLFPFQTAAAGMQRIQELLDEQPGVVEAHDAASLPAFSREIRFEEVSFSYTGVEANLDRVSLDIPAGQSVALVGPSGCGKSTALGLLLRFHDPTAGAVTIDGQDLRTVAQASLRAQLGVVFQESFLFDTTIRENIRLGRTDATDEDVEAAARAAEIHETVIALPESYETRAGERGGLLSGGQRQRIALARAILRQPAIVLLDEATSALDAQTEAAINATLERLRKDHTIVSVTHRLASVANADRIFVLEKGRLVEQGTHQALLDLKGAYHRAWHRQSGFLLSDDGQRVEVQPGRLRGIPLFESLTESQLAALANRFITERYLAGETIFNEGDLGDRLHIIVRGSVEVLKDGNAGEANRVAVLEDGDFFGEIALLEDVPRTATVRASTPCLLLALNREQLYNLLQIVPELRTVLESAAEARERELANLSA